MFGIGCGIFDREAGVEPSSALVECFVPVPLVRAVLCGDDYGTGGGASGVGVFLGGAYGEFLNHVG